ncbi:hypothetical protein BDQ12DRAFT_475905 [Crucibulum laeve]|uniref:Uncharacterized protein n=1 Tax=Crucibulum laeve TaxID=68775 RepID=A0A5C3LIZ1_9AGAR|nr:hypothetical protein BDQ12DRAFT_475905 [Crucibulum laeve]
MATPQAQLDTTNLALIPPTPSSSDDGSSTSKGDSLLRHGEEPATPATSHPSPVVEGFAELKVADLANTTTTTTSASSPSTHTNTTPPISHADPSLSAHEHDTFKSKYAAPPPVKNPYKPSEALDDIPGVSYALELFLASKMLESEEYCHKSDEKKERLYFATGYGLIQCVKGLMSYEDDDLLAGIAHTKQGNLIASQHRKKAGLLSLGGLLGGGGVNWIKSMTPVERHAELVYAESLFEKVCFFYFLGGTRGE